LITCIIEGMTDTAISDPFLHLEAVDSYEALGWVRECSDRTIADLAAGDHAEAAHSRALEILDASDRIAWPVLRGRYAYTLWKDGDHPRGLWRRVPWTVLADGAPGVDHPDWETLVDVGALADEEGVNWVYSGTVVRRPVDDRALLRLSRGGADAVEVREFDLTERRFVTAGEGAFHLPEAKCSVSWVDRATVLLTAPLDPDGSDATDSGYARVVRLWRRGTDPAQAPVIFEGRTDDVAVGASHDPVTGRFLASRAPDFHTSQEVFWTPGTDPASTTPLAVPVPEDCDVTSCGDWLMLRPRTDLEIAGRSHPGGSVLVVPWAAVDAEPDHEDVARQIVLRQLAMAPRSRAQLETKLRQRDCPEDVITRVLDRMTEVGLVDDEAYAAMLVRSQQATKGLAKRALAHELRKKGIDKDLADAALDEVDPEEERRTARELVDKKLRSMGGLTVEVQTRRLAGMLARKGYGSGVAYSVIRDAIADAPEHQRD